MLFIRAYSLQRTIVRGAGQGPPSDVEKSTVPADAGLPEGTPSAADETQGEMNELGEANTEYTQEGDPDMPKFEKTEV